MFPDLALAVAFTLLFIPTFPYEYEYISYVTIGQLATTLRRFFWSWLGWSVGLLALLFIRDTAPFATPLNAYDSALHSIYDFLPVPVWYVIGIMFFTWTLRGTELKYPKWNGKQWLLLNSLIAVGVAFYFLVGTKLPKPLLAIIGVSLWKVVEVYAALIQEAKDSHNMR